MSRYTVVLREKSPWGDIWAILDPKGKEVGLDRKTVAEQRCAALNSADAVKS
jgi:hypothetical protein